MKQVLNKQAYSSLQSMAELDEISRVQCEIFGVNRVQVGVKAEFFPQKCLKTPENPTKTFVLCIFACARPSFWRALAASTKLTRAYRCQILQTGVHTSHTLYSKVKS